MLPILTLLSSLAFAHFRSTDPVEVSYVLTEKHVDGNREISQTSSLGTLEETNYHSIQCIDNDDQATLRQVSCIDKNEDPMGPAAYSELTTDIWELTTTSKENKCMEVCEGARKHMVNQKMECPDKCVDGDSK